jgi:ubiquinol-cytochrome c reductase cytochrome b subunit
MASTEGWWEQRTGLGASVRAAIHEAIPGGARFTYTLGSATLLTFLTLCVTGIFQLMYYVPSVASAYNSVNFLRFQVPLGWLVHGLHFWAANAMVVLVVVHLTQVFIWGAYKKPRELVWILGVALLVFTLGAVFTGGPLPWDERGYWAARVASGIAGGIPFIGSWVQLKIFGGSVVGQLTLSRFFALHVAIVPIMIGLVFLLHLVTFRKAGSAGTWNRSDRIGDFWPRQVLMDLLVFALVLTACVGLSAVLLTPVTGPADPIDATYVARPDWPFLFLFQMLKYFPGSLEAVGTTVIPTLGLLLVLALPWLDRGPDRSPAKRPVAVGAFAVIVAVLAALTWLGAQAPTGALTPPTGAPPPTPASAISTATPLPGPTVASYTIGGVEHGQGIYISFCQQCHGIDGKGGVPNPGSGDGTVPEINPMDPEIMGKTTQEFVNGIDKYIQYGSAAEPKAEGDHPKYSMPSFGLNYTLTQQQISDVEAYVLQLNGVDRAAIVTPGVNPMTFWWVTLAGFVVVAVVGGAALATTRDA